MIEGKHSKTNSLPSLEDIKDGLLKMILFTNLEDVEIDGEKYKSVIVLKLTAEGGFNENNLIASQRKVLETLKREAIVNNFSVVLNKRNFSAKFTSRDN